MSILWFTLNTITPPSNRYAEHRQRCQGHRWRHHVLVAGAGCQAAAEAAAKIAGVSKVLVADNAAYANQLAENVSLLVAELGKGYSHMLAAGDHHWQELPAACGCPAGREPDFRNHQGGQLPTPLSVRFMPVTPSPPCSPRMPSRC
jgi:hypothetical protein